jgi:hypothetical protein
MKEPRPYPYSLDNARMIYLLKKRYIPDQEAGISEEQERAMMRLA